MPERVAVTVDRPSSGALGWAVLAAVLLFAFTVAAACFALGLLDGAAATVNRVLAAVVGLAALALLAVVLTGARRQGAELVLSADGVTLTDRTGTHELGWPDIAEATVAEPDGPKRARSGAATLRLRPHDAKDIAENPAWRDRLALPEPGAEPVFWLIFDLPDSAAAQRIRDAVTEFGPTG